MGSVLADPDGYSPDDIVLRLHRCIDQGIYGIDYTIIPRGKNEELLEKYIISESDRIAVLRKLTAGDYDGWEYSDNKDYSHDIIHLFHYGLTLFPRGVENAPGRKIKLYIKVTWTKPGNALIVISFHE